MAAVIHSGAAKNHRANPAASLRLEKMYGAPVLMSGLGSLILTKSEISHITKHHKETLRQLLRLPPRTPQVVLYFLAGSLPGEALVHLRQLSLLGMVRGLPGSLLHRYCLQVFYKPRRYQSSSWFHQVRNLCLKYLLPHPLNLLSPTSPHSKEAFKSIVRKHVLNYWETNLREEASNLKSLRFFKPEFLSLAKPHPIFISAGSSSYEVSKATIQALFMSGRYRTEKLSRHWSTNPEGYCQCPSCLGLQVVEDEEHILLHCGSLAPTRTSLANLTVSYSKANPLIGPILLAYTNPRHPHFSQFLVDCSVLPEIITLTQQFGESQLFKLFKITRTWCYSLHRDRLKILGRWSKTR